MRLGDLDALKVYVKHTDLTAKEKVALLFAIAEAPTIDAVPVKQSFWESYETSAYGGYDEDGVRWLKRRFFRCERCRKGSAIKSNFCPNCGADMGERKEAEGDG